MDSGQDNLGSEILQTGKSIEKLLRQKLCPYFVRDEENIMLTSPGEEADYRVGIHLYDIQDYSFVMPQISQTFMINDKESRMPPKAVELSYLVFCNENQRFGGSFREQTHEILNEIIRAVYDNPVLERDEDEAVQISFLRKNVDFKIRLWGSFNQPLRPAVYLHAVPVLIASERLRRIDRVEERDYGVKKI